MTRVPLVGRTSACREEVRTVLRSWMARAEALDHRVLGRPVSAGRPFRRSWRARLHLVVVVAIACCGFAVARWSDAWLAGLSLSIAAMIGGFLVAASEGRRRSREAYGDDF